MVLGLFGSFSYVSFRQVIVVDLKAVAIADMDAKLHNLRDSCEYKDLSWYYELDQRVLLPLRWIQRVREHVFVSRSHQGKEWSAVPKRRLRGSFQAQGGGYSPPISAGSRIYNRPEECGYTYILLASEEQGRGLVLSWVL
jgi:hypothetical protein